MTTITHDENFVNNMETFLKEVLNQTPPATEIKVNAFAGNSNYLPISFVQMKLDEIFCGLWEFQLGAFQIVANEIIATGTLKIYHPVAKIWITRSGAAAVMIQQKADSSITDIEAKIKNTLIKDFPHLESEVLKSAAKKFGQIFGRDLNRKMSDVYTPVYEQAGEVEEIKQKVLEAASVDVLAELFKNTPSNLVTVGNLKKIFTARKIQIEFETNKNLQDVKELNP